MTALWEARPTNPTRPTGETRHVPVGAPGMPADTDLEETVLGSILVAEQILPILTGDEQLAGDCFYRLWHRNVFDAMTALHGRSEPVDTVTVRQQLVTTGMAFEQAERVDLLVAAVVNLGNVRAYARRLVELAAWRSVKRAGMELVVAADTLDTPRREKAEASLGRPSKQTHSQDGEQLAAMLFTHLEGGESVRTVPLAFHGLTGPMAGGLRESETTLLGGWTSMGKSACLDAILTHAARAGRKVHLYINEMTVRIRAMRIVAAEARVPLSRLLSPQTMTVEDRAAVVRTQKQGLPFGITDVFGWTAEEIARDMRLRAWDLVGVDILHLIPHREVRDLDEISQTLTLAAKSSGAHLIATAHLNEERAKTAILPPPVLRDLRGSGMLKNNTDNVLFVHREQDVDEHGTVTLTDQGGLVVAKCRNGALGGVPVQFEGRYVRYREVPR